jgi:hypothetical protein
MDYPMRHISIRVPWHDTGWDGRVCAAPHLNGACLKLRRMALLFGERDGGGVGGAGGLLAIFSRYSSKRGC